MVQPLGNVGSPFRPTTRKRSWDCTTTMRRREVGVDNLVLSHMQDKTEREFFLQRLQTSSAGSKSRPSGLSRIWASPARHCWYYFFHFWPLVQTLERGPTVGSSWGSSAPPSLGRGRVASPPPPGIIVYLIIN